MNAETTTNGGLLPPIVPVPMPVPVVLVVVVAVMVKAKAKAKAMAIVTVRTVTRSIIIPATFFDDTVIRFERV